MFHAPSEEHPFTVGAPENRSVTGLMTIEAIDAVLDDLDTPERSSDEENPWLVMVHLDGDEAGKVMPTMNIGIGGDRVAVHWNVGATGNAMARSERAEDAEDLTEVEYQFFEDYSWSTAQWLVPKEAARQAVREWLRTGQRPTVIVWEEL